MPKALVTGATGFIGKHLVRKLIDIGWNIAVVVRKQSNLEELYAIADKNKISVFYYDGYLQSLCDCFQQVQIDVVFHLASCFIAEHKPEDIAQLVESNVLFSTQLLEAMTLAKVSCFVNTGTAWQHYNDQVYSPVCLYAATKQAFEDILLYYVETKKVRALTLELFDTYGPYDTRKKLFYLLNKAVQTGEVIEFSPGEQLLNLVHIQDVLSAYILAAEMIIQAVNGTYKKYSVNADENIQLKELVALYEKIRGVTVRLNWGARPYRSREVMVPWTKGKRLEHWRPEIDLHTGLRSI